MRSRIEPQSHVDLPEARERAAVPVIRVLHFDPTPPADGPHERLSFWQRVRREHGRRRRSVVGQSAGTLGRANSSS